MEKNILEKARKEKWNIPVVTCRHSSIHPMKNNCSPVNYIFLTCIMISHEGTAKSHFAMAQFIPASHSHESLLHQVGKGLKVKAP